MSMFDEKYPRSPFPAELPSPCPHPRPASKPQHMRVDSRFTPVSLLSPHVHDDERGGGGLGGGGGREERRHATLPLTPPLSDWKVMGLKETFSQHSPHL